MAKQLTDDEQNLRRKARRRLIGAIALTLAVVVILPMVLDSEPRPARQDIDLRIPAPDKVGEFVPGEAASEVAGVSPFAAPAVVAVSAPPPASTDVTASQTASDAATSGVAQDAAEPVAEPASSAAAPGKDQPAANGKPESKSADKPASLQGYVAQAGAYANADTAKRELEKLKKWGFSKAYTEKTGDKIRVRVGPYPEREDAEKVRQLLEKHGLKPVVMIAH